MLVTLPHALGSWEDTARPMPKSLVSGFSLEYVPTHAPPHTQPHSEATSSSSS